VDVAEIEKKVFRQLVSNPKVLVQYINKVSPEDFTTPIIKNVVGAFSANASALASYVPSKAFFEILLRDRFHNPAELDQVANVISGLASTPVDPKDLEMLLRELKANRMCREMTQVIQKRLPQIRPDTIEDAYNDILKDLLQLPLNAASGINVAALKEVHEALEERVLDYLKPVTAKISTTIRAFDAVMGGFALGELVMVSAPQGHGKSNILLWWAERMAEAGNNTLYVTIEMGYEETLNRYHSIQTGFDTLDIAFKKIPKSKEAEYFEKLIAASKEKSARQAFLRECATIKDRSDPHGALALSKKYRNRPAKMFIMDLPRGCTPARVEQEIQRLSMDNKIDCVFVDFINVMDPDFHNKDRARELATIARELKVAARKCKVLLFSAAQLDSGNMEGTQDEKITLDMIKYSRAIGENSDWVIAFYRTEEDNLKKQIRLQLAKHRHSSDVTALLEFDFATLQAIDLGFASDSPMPYGYLRNGLRLEEFIAEEKTKPDPVQQTLDSLITEEASGSTAASEVAPPVAASAPVVEAPVPDNEIPEGWV
jgi:replicative DNA helicase